ncbi:carbohydrate kinase family protein [Mycoplasmopsis cricetuli]|uniref:hypothetical protein n=1 Tax=Mycoplasmopsis cricetuli TaxID=171283 RepID=UPI0004AC979E|nr:hypothetical protein [Mycoplasmopsis cricetuli]
MKFLTITLAPSLDCYFSCETLNLNKTNRYDLSQLFPGGKGINASLALARHNFETKAISFFDQLSYKKFENFFKQEKISFVNINSKESTRINFKCNQNNPYNFNFELNGPISIISNSQEYQLFNELKELTSNDFVCLWDVDLRN